MALFINSFIMCAKSPITFNPCICTLKLFSIILVTKAIWLVQMLNWIVQIKFYKKLIFLSVTQYKILVFMV